MVELVFWFGGRAFGGLAGMLAAASVVCMPRVFGHAHLATLDVTMAATWLLSVVVFARAVEAGGWRWGMVSGLCLGLALLTKINAVFLPLALVGWGLGFHGRRAVVPLVLTLGIGVAVFFAGWPWLWPAPLERAWAYVRPTWRVAIPVTYFGRVYLNTEAPFHYPIVMTLVTMPVGILFLALVGLSRAVRGFRGSPLLALLVVNVVVAMGPFVTPWLPKYDGVRLWLPAFPFLALLAGVGGAQCWGWVAERSRRRPWRPLFVTAVFFLLQAGAVVWARPYYLSYYNALVGGLWGAQRLGLETTYWHDVVDRRLFRWLNRNARWGDRIAFYPVGEKVTLTDRRAFDFYEAFYLGGRKELRAVRYEGGVRPDYLVLNARTALLRRDERAWGIFTTRQPLYAVRRQGVLLAGVYELR
jgi:4-amino-4-deoxy-L-arabinose transferase-like glycosyltransferase